MLKLKLQYFGHLMQQSNSFKKTLMLGKIEGRRRGRQRMRWLDSITDVMDMNLSRLWDLVMDRDTWHAAVCGVTKSRTCLRNNLWWLRRQSVSLQCGRRGFHPWVGKIPWRRKWQPTPVLLPGKSPGWGSLVGYSPMGHD